MQYITEEDLQAMGVSQLAQRRQLMAAVKTQQQYKELNDRIALLERENEDLSASHTHARTKVNGLSSELAAAHASAEALQVQLEAERDRAEVLSANATTLMAQLEYSQEQRRAADERAAGFAADADAALCQLHATLDGQRSAFRDLKLRIDKSTVAMRGAVRSGNAPGAFEEMRRMASSKRLSGNNLLHGLGGGEGAAMAASASGAHAEHTSGSATGAASALRPACR